MKTTLLDTLWSLAVRRGRLLLIVTDGCEKQKITDLITTLIRRDSLYMIAAGDWLPGYGLARMLRCREVRLADRLERGRLERPFTCRQLMRLLAAAAPDGKPMLILDFLNLFYDAAIPLPLRCEMLNACCWHLQRLARANPVTVTVQQEAIADYRYFYPFLAGIATETLQPAPAVQDVSERGLF
jgi:hypothetical protein